MELISTHFVKTQDVGYHGNLFGGVMLAWLDEAAAAYAAQAAEDILIVKAGGNSGIYSNLIMNYYGVEATTVPIVNPKS